MSITLTFLKDYEKRRNQNGPEPAHDVVVSAVKNAVKAAMMT